MNTNISGILSKDLFIDQRDIKNNNTYNLELNLNCLEYYFIKNSKNSLIHGTTLLSLCNSV